MRNNRGRWWAVTAGVLALALGCGGTPGETSESSSGTRRGRASAIDTPQGGTTAWVRQLGGAGYEGLEDMAPAPDGGVVLVTHIGKSGPRGSDAATLGLVWLRADRTVAWSREFPVVGARLRWPRVAVTGLGNVFLLVTTLCSTTCPDLGGGRPTGNQLTLLAKYSPSGAFVWERVIDGWNDTPAVAVDANGTAALAVVRAGTGPAAGPRLLEYRWDGALRWDLPAPAVNGDGVAPLLSALAFDPGGNLAVADNLAFYSVDPAGKLRWSHRLADPSVQGLIRTIGATSLGTVVVVAQPSLGTVSFAGTTYTASLGGAPTAGFLAVAEASGAPRFGRVLPPDDLIAAASVDPAGRVAIAYVGVDGGRTEKWNLAGDRLWVRTFSPIGWQVLAIDPLSHHVRAASSFTGTIDVGTGPVTSRGEWDNLVVDLWP